MTPDLAILGTLYRHPHADATPRGLLEQIAGESERVQGVALCLAREVAKALDAGQERATWVFGWVGDGESRASFFGSPDRSPIEQLADLTTWAAPLMTHTAVLVAAHATSDAGGIGIALTIEDWQQTGERTWCAVATNGVPPSDAWTPAERGALLSVPMRSDVNA